MNDRQKDILRHALGLGRKGREKRAYRTHFVTGPGCTDFDDCVALTGDGLLKDYGDRDGLYGGDHIFIVTEIGAAAVGSQLPED